jgi:hypothetical protein
MQRTRLVLAQLLCLILGACAPARPEVSSTPSPPAPVSKWTITLTQSGGLAGVDMSIRVSSDGQLAATDERSGRQVSGQLTPSSIAEIDGLYGGALSVTQTPQPSSCADCFVYDLEIASPDGSTKIHLDDTSLPNAPAEPLVRYLVQLRNETLATP